MLQDFELQVRELPLGTHACLVYSTPEERNAAVVPFLNAGLKAGHRCLFMADDAIREEVAESLGSQELDLASALDAGQLVFESERDSYRRHGNFAPGEMLTMLAEGVDAAETDGYTGLRASGEMTWPIDDTGEATGLMVYEARVNHVLEDRPVMALCLYDRTRFPAEVIVDVLRAHPVALVGDQVYRNLFYERPQAILSGVSADERLDWMLAQLEQARQDEVRAVRLEAQLRQAQKMDAMGRLSSGVAHDFNNLLTAITGYASLVREDLDPASPHREMIDGIMDAAERGASLTQKLLAFGRDHGRSEQAVDVGEVIRGLDSILDRLIPESIILEQNLADDISPAWGDPHGLEQVLLNLVLNARDAVGEQGRITIAARDGLASDGSRGVVITVTDDGAGIREEIRDQIFEPFFTSKPSGRGTGLGLATAHGIVRQAGGEITVESIAGGGSTFRVVLPLARDRETHDPVAEAGKRSVDPERASRPEAILVIDDEEPVRDLVERVLTRNGHRVITAADGKEALAVVQASGAELALVISDIRLVHMDGIELVGEIREIRPDLPALMISGDTSGVRIQDLADTELMEKPFTANQLNERVDRILGRA